jgi:hypothetical protein
MSAITQMTPSTPDRIEAPDIAVQRNSAMNISRLRSRRHLVNARAFYQDNRGFIQVLVVATLALVVTAFCTPYSLFGF